MTNFTLHDLMYFTQKEEEMVKDVLLEMQVNGTEPSESSVNTLLAYSKALSIRKSNKLKTISLILN